MPKTILSVLEELCPPEFVGGTKPDGTTEEVDLHAHARDQALTEIEAIGKEVIGTEIPHVVGESQEGKDAVNFANTTIKYQRLRLQERLGRERKSE